MQKLSRNVALVFLPVCYSTLYEPGVVKDVGVVLHMFDRYILTIARQSYTHHFERDHSSLPVYVVSLDEFTHGGDTRLRIQYYCAGYTFRGPVK